MHACGDKIIDLFNGKSGEGQSMPGESIMSNPAKLCYVVKQGLREASIGKFYFEALFQVSLRIIGANFKENFFCFSLFYS